MAMSSVVVSGVTSPGMKEVTDVRSNGRIGSTPCVVCVAMAGCGGCGCGCQWCCAGCAAPVALYAGGGRLAAASIRAAAAVAGLRACLQIREETGNLGGLQDHQNDEPVVRWARRAVASEPTMSCSLALSAHVHSSTASAYGLFRKCYMGQRSPRRTVMDNNKKHVADD